MKSSSADARISEAQTELKIGLRTQLKQADAKDPWGALFYFRITRRVLSFSPYEY